MFKLMFLVSVTICSAISKCPDNCTCSGTSLECFKGLPSFIPVNVTSVTAAGWQKVIDLTLMLGNGNQTGRLPYRTLQNYEFTGLINLEYLKLLCNCFLIKIMDNAFLGLIKVRTLDLSRNQMPKALTHSILQGLYNENILTNLSTLSLSDVAYRDTIYHLDLSYLHSAMVNKPLHNLDLSGTNIEFGIGQNPPQGSLLPQLRTLNISRAQKALFTLPNLYKYFDRPEAIFTNLETLDASYPYFPLSGSDCLQDPIYSSFCSNTQSPGFLPYNLTELYVRNIFKSAISFNGLHNSTHICITANFFKKNRTLCITGNFISLRKLDISESSIAFIQPDLIHPFEGLKYLNLTKNRLGQALSDETYAASFFHALRNLNILTLSYNEVNVIPKDSLRYNKQMKTLDMSHNYLLSVDFGINYLSSLERLDLSYNRIAYLDSSECNLLKSLQMFENNNPSEGYGLVLEGNPVACSCNNLCFMKLTVDLNETNNCQSNNKTEMLDFSYVKQFEYRCKEAVVISTFTIFGVVTFFLSIAGVYFIVKDRRKNKLKRLKETGIEAYGSCRKKYVVFLSFSGDDEDFVMTRVYPQIRSRA